MPRDASGTYTAPLPPVVDGTVIEASYENTTTADQSNEFTDSLSRSGKGSMLSALRVVDGSVAAPGISWNSEASSGWYRGAPGDVRFALLGQDLIRAIASGPQIWDGAQWNNIAYAGGPELSAKADIDSPTFTGAPLFPSGTTAAPGIGFADNTNTGLIYTGNAILVVVNGVEIAKFDVNGITCIDDVKAFTAV